MLLLVFSSAYTVDTGDVAVTKTVGNVDLDEVGPGLHFRQPMLTQVQQFSAKEDSFDLTNPTPKAADKLSLRELDVTVYYGVCKDKIADLVVKYAGVFSIQRVVVRALNTDPSIEQSIQLAVQNQKKLEAKKIEVAKAEGIAKANRIINASLTAEYLQHEINMALAEFARHDGQTVVIPANMQGLQVLLSQDNLRRAPAAAQ